MTDSVPAPCIHEGGCLCGNIRYMITAEPIRVTICHCTFCQRSTGSAFLVEPIFRKQDIEFSGHQAKTYNHRSDTSGKQITLRFCGRCGTKVALSFERFPDVFGICGGTFDDPNWFARSSQICRHIFVRSAQKGVVLPTGVAVYSEHAIQLDGTPNDPSVLTHALVVAR